MKNFNLALHGYLKNIRDRSMKYNLEVISNMKIVENVEFLSDKFNTQSLFHREFFPK
jgi:hypothetical protein